MHAINWNGLNRDRLPERALDPPEHNEHPCFDCAGAGLAGSIYDHITQDAGWVPRYGTRIEMEFLREMLQERWLHQTCERHWGGES